MKLPRAHHLSPDTLAGQVLMPMINASFFNKNTPSARRLRRLLDRYQVGGFILFHGHPADVRSLTTWLQKESPYPLLIGADLERGLHSVFSQGTMFPHALAFGACQEEGVIQDAAKVLAQETRSVGINLIFGPSLDLANDPDNPIINIRAYHSRSEVVTRLAKPIIQTVQQAGIACVGKHFPGHGATKADSHSELPTLYKSLAELQENELQPYPEVIEAGVKGLMVGHLKLPEFDRPATFESRLVQKVIRKDWRYPGVVFSDALDMGAISDNYAPWEWAFGSLEAGVDILLMPPQLPLVHELLVRRIRRDEAFRQVMMQAVERIFSLKRWLVRHQPAHSHPGRIYKMVEHPNHVGIANKAAEASITLVRHSRDFPLDLPNIQKAVHLIVTDASLSGQPLQEFCRQLNDFFSTTMILNNPESQALDALPGDEETLWIISLYFRTFSGNPQVIEQEKIKALLKQIAHKPGRKVIFLFGNPYKLNTIPEAQFGDAVFLTYSYVDVTQKAAFKALISAIDISGKLPISLAEPFQQSISLAAHPHSLLKSTQKQPLSRELTDLIEEALKQRVFPGCVLLAAREGKVVLHKAFGRLDYHHGAPCVQPATVYDLASLTKVLATTPAIMKLLEQRQLALTDTLSHFYPGAAGQPAADVTIADLLSHQSGFPAWKPLYQLVEHPDQVIDYLLKMPLEYPVGSKAVYSDLGFILLGDIVQRITGSPFEVFCRDHLFSPMGLTSLVFNPDEKKHSRIPPTGVADALGRQLIQGQVNDANCFMLGGVSGHAGLFGAAEDVAAVGQLFIQNGIYQAQRLFREDTVRLFTRPHRPQISARTPGWDTPTPPSSSGTHFSAASIGHLGFTGTSLWVDLQKRIIVVMLCNRTHPQVDEHKIKQFRPEIHNAIMTLALMNGTI